MELSSGKDVAHEHQIAGQQGRNNHRRCERNRPAAALLFASEGAKIMVSDFNQAGGEETVETVRKAGGEAYFCYCDVREEAQVKALVERTVEQFGRIDWAFNNAGISSEEAVPLHETTTEAFSNVIQTNLFGYYYCMKHELKYMAEAEKGAIVNTLSINSVCCTPEGASYGVSKYGGYGLVQTASLDYASLGIRINAVGPGPTKTPMIMHCSETHPEVISYLESTIPDGRMGEAIEQANAALYLLSDFASHITGQLLLVDGGQSAKM